MEKVFSEPLIPKDNHDSTNNNSSADSIYSRPTNVYNTACTTNVPTRIDNVPTASADTPTKNIDKPTANTNISTTFKNAPNIGSLSNDAIVHIMSFLFMEPTEGMMLLEPETNSYPYCLSNTEFLTLRKFVPFLVNATFVSDSMNIRLVSRRWNFCISKYMLGNASLRDADANSCYTSIKDNEIKAAMAASRKLSRTTESSTIRRIFNALVRCVDKVCKRRESRKISLIDHVKMIEDDEDREEYIRDNIEPTILLVCNLKLCIFLVNTYFEFIFSVPDAILKNPQFYSAIDKKYSKQMRMEFKRRCIQSLV